MARLGHRARFIGQVGDDAIGRSLVDELRADGVEMCITWGGRTGSIVVLVDELGERSMLTDRGSSRELGPMEPAWLDGVDALHVPLYSLMGGALATTGAALVTEAHRRGVRVSIDASSAALIATEGATTVVDACARSARPCCSATPTRLRCSPMVPRLAGWPPRSWSSGVEPQRCC